MVCSELPDSEFLLKALAPGIDEDMAKKEYPPKRTWLSR
jgi:hypothetical protein